LPIYRSGDREEALKSLRERLPNRVPFFYGWVILGCVMAASYARQGAAVATLSIFVTPMGDEFAWSRTAMAGAVSLGGLLGGAVSPLIGPFVDRQGARLVLVVSALVMASTCFALAGTQTLLWFYIAFGIGRLTFAAPFDVGISAPVANWFVRKRAMAMACVSLGIGVGLAVMPLMAQLVIDDFGWRAGWVALGVSVIVVGAIPNALLMIRRPEDVGLKPDGDQSDSPEDVQTGPEAAGAQETSFTLRQAARTPAFWLLMFYTGTCFTVQAGVSLHQAPHFVHRGLDPTVAAGVVSVFSLASALSSLVFGYLGGRWPIRYGMILAALFVSAGAGLTHLAHDVAAAYSSAAVFGCGVGGLMTLSIIAFADYFGRDHFGAIRGVVIPVQSLGQAIGPVLSGLAFDLFGDYGLAFWFYAVLGLFAAVSALLALPPRPSRAGSL